MSDNESMFFPKPYLSFLFVFRATQPSVESNTIAKIIKNAASQNSWLIEHKIDKNPEAMFNKDMKSDIDTKCPMLVFSISMF